MYIGVHDTFVDATTTTYVRPRDLRRLLRSAQPPASWSSGVSIQPGRAWTAFHNLLLAFYHLKLSFYHLKLSLHHLAMPFRHQILNHAKYYGLLQNDFVLMVHTVFLVTWFSGKSLRLLPPEVIYLRLKCSKFYFLQRCHIVPLARFNGSISKRTEGRGGKGKRSRKGRERGEEM